MGNGTEESPSEVADGLSLIRQLSRDDLQRLVCWVPNIYGRMGET